MTNHFLVEKLGIRPRHQDRFYVHTLSAFYETVSKGLTEKEVPNLLQSLKVVIDYLESTSASSWEKDDITYWKKLLVFSYLDLNYEQSIEGARYFFKVMEQLVTFLADKEGLRRFSEELLPLVTNYESEVLDAVRLLDAYQQKVENPFATGLAEMERETLLEEAGSAPTIEGVFELKGTFDEQVIAHHLLIKKDYPLRLSVNVKDLVHPATTVIGVLKEQSGGVWEILVLDRVFPPAALPFLKQAIGV